MLNSKLFPILRTLLSTKKFCFENILKINSRNCSSSKEKILDICGKLVVITGATSEIGLATAKELLNKEAKHVILASIDEGSAEEAVDRLNAHHGEGACSSWKLDVTSPREFQELFSAVECKGGVDILINNAGILNDDEWCHEIDVNYTGLVRSCLTAMKHMESSEEGGCIINVSAAFAIDPFPYTPIFTATKSAVLTFHRSISDECLFKETNIRYVVALPGRTTTIGMNDIEQKLYDNRWAKDAQHSWLEYVTQEPIHVAKGIIYGIEYGEPGAIILIENKEIREVTIPPKSAYCKHVASLITNVLRQPQY